MDKVKIIVRTASILLVFSVLSMKSVSLYISIVSFDQSILISSFKDYTFLSSVLHIEYKLRTARVDRSAHDYRWRSPDRRRSSRKGTIPGCTILPTTLPSLLQDTPDAESEDNTEEEVEEVDGATANELDSEEE